MVAASAAQLIQRLPAKRKKKNASAKQLRARKKARAAARAARTHPAVPALHSDLNETMKDLSKASEARPDATEAVPDVVEAPEPVPGAGGAVTDVSISSGRVPVVSEATNAAVDLTEPVATASEAILVSAEAALNASVVTATLPGVKATLPGVKATLPGVKATFQVPVATVPLITEGNVSRAPKEKRTRGSLASFIRTLEEDEEEEEYRQFVTSGQTAAIKARESDDLTIAHTNSTNSDTNSSDTNSDGDDSDSEIYWRIYGKNYERSELTVTANFASTKQTWNIARINDRRGDSLMTYQYQVLWVNPSVKKRRYYQRTWEPRAQLLADDFRQEIELVDRWKSSKLKTFAAFWPTDEYGKNAIGADMQGLCVFNALRRAAELCGRPDIVTQRDIDDFVADQLASRGIDMTKGTSWKVVLVFLRRLRDSGRDFIYRAIALDNFAVAGRRGVRVLNEIPLKDGVYVVAAYNHRNVGHACVLTVQGKTRLIYDLDEGEPIESAEDWIDFYAFVRPFIVCKQK